MSGPFPQADVTVIGGGHAGLCAAISAAREGASVTLLESAPITMRGGNSRHTRNLRARHDGPLVTLTGTYDADEYFQDLLRVTQGATDEALARLTIDESAGLVGWLSDQGVHFQPALSGTLNLNRTNAFFLGGGCALMNTLYEVAEAAGVAVFYDAEVIALDIEDGLCRSLTIQHAGETQTLGTTSVVAASGGFQANEEWMRDAWGEAADNFLIRGTPYNRGLVLRALLDGGAAAVGDPQQCHAVAIDARAPRYDGGIVSRLDCVPFGIVVNKTGQRFYDEGEDFWPKRYAIWGRLVAQQPGQIAYAIIDNKVRNNFMPSVFPPVEAGSIADLAAAIDVPADKLEMTITQYNAAVQDGTYNPDELDGCRTRSLTPDKTHWALALDEPPYLAYPLRPGITFTYLGVKVDAEARVLMNDGRASENLFAAGEIMAGNVLGQGYCAGTGMTIGGVFGRIAGREAACLKR